MQPPPTLSTPHLHTRAPRIALAPVPTCHVHGLLRCSCVDLGTRAMPAGARVVGRRPERNGFCHFEAAMASVSGCSSHMHATLP